MKLQLKQGSVLTTALLIAGAAIGSGMFGIPVMSGISGFLPGLVMSFLIWLIMIATGLLLAEVTLALPDGANVLSMSEHYFGRIAKYLWGAVYVLLLYSLMTSYLYRTEPLVTQFIDSLFGFSLPRWTAGLLIALIFGITAFLGTWFSSRLNFVLLMGLFLTFLFIFIGGIPKVQSENLIRSDWIFSILSAPVLFNAYGFQWIIPTLVTYLNRDIKKIRSAIFWGMLPPFLIYSLWQWLMIGALSEGSFWLAYEKGDAITEGFLLSLKTLSHPNLIYFFFFFAVTTTIIGVSISMIDFFSDGYALKPEERLGQKRVLLTFLVFLPPLFLTTFFPEVIIQFLQYAGGFLTSLIFGIFPVTMAWASRNRDKNAFQPLLFGGKGMLLTLLFFIFFIAYLHGLEIIH